MTGSPQPADWIDRLFGGAAVLFIVGAIAVVIWLRTGHSFASPQSPAPMASPTINPMLYLPQAPGYWYCWNSGAADPHHLGHRVPNDHPCTEAELRAAVGAR